MSRSPLAVLLVLVTGLAGACSSPAGQSTTPPPLPPFLCHPCSVDADCGGPLNRCLDVTGGAACGTDCGGTSCPAGFTCAAIVGGGNNCIPTTGTCPPPCGGACADGWYCDPASNTCAPAVDAGAPPVDGSRPPDAPPARDAAQWDAPAPSLGVTIIVEPSDNGNGLYNAIVTAKSSVHMTMYLLTSSAIIDALIGAHQAGRDVKVLLNQNFFTGESNAGVYSQLESAGVAVRWAPSTFTLTHEKCVIIDGHTAWIMTMNATNSSASSNREYLAVDTEPDDVAEAEAIFQADYNNTSITPSGKLLVSPDNSRDRLIALIDSAMSTIDMEGGELSDYLIVDHLVYAAAARRVAVKIVLSDDPPSSGQTDALPQLKNAGVQLVTLSHPYMHAKSIVVDGTSAYVGSINFTTASLMHNRELGVIVATPSEVQKVLTTTRTDFANGTPL